MRLEIKKKSPSPHGCQTDPLLDLWPGKHINDEIIKNTHSNNWKGCLAVMFFNGFSSFGHITEVMKLSSEAAGTQKGIYRTDQLCFWEHMNCQQPEHAWCENISLPISTAWQSSCLTTSLVVAYYKIGIFFLPLIQKKPGG